MGVDSVFTGARWRPGLPPGVYEHRPESVSPAEVRMDVAAFVGLAERGPVCVPQVVESWSQFVSVFGLAGGGRLMPQSVHGFFANGGRRCVVVRAVHYGAALPTGWRLPGLATASTSGSVVAYARDPGSWGDRLDGRLTVDLVPVPVELDLLDPSTLVAEEDPQLQPGTTLRLARVRLDSELADPDDDRIAEQLVVVVSVDLDADGRTLLSLSQPLAPGMDTELVLDDLRELRVELVLTLGSYREVWSDAALDPAHPRFLLATLASESSLLRPAASVAAERVEPTLALSRGERVAFWPAEPDLSGTDAAELTGRDHLFSAPADHDVPAVVLDDADRAYLDRPAPLDSLADYDSSNETQPVSLVTMPDLVHPDQGGTPAEVVDELAQLDDPLRFRECTPTTASTTTAEVDAYPLLSADDLDDVAAWQTVLVQHGEATGGRITILDLPPGLTRGEIVRWRRAHASPRAASYAPYLRVQAAQDPDAPLVTMPPGGVVCGVVATREANIGVHAAIGNVVLRDVVSLFDDVGLPDPAFLHDERINALRATEQGLTLLGSRTTSRVTDWTHINVRRLIDYLERQLALDARWAVFEPNDRRLWARLRRSITRRLDRLFQAQAFEGESPDQAYFVRCDADVNDQRQRDAGRCVALVGVAPSVPAEFIVFRLSLQRDGTTEVGVSGG